MSNEKKFKKIVMVGPVYPYKGGISHYTGLMYRALSKKYDVTMVSFKFQYPKILYKKEQRDYTNDSFKIKGTEYWINTANPFNWISSAKKIRKLKPDLVIFQWWHPYFAPCYYVMNKMLKKIKVLFVCHNVFPHERFPMDKLLARFVLKQGKSFIVQSQKDAEDLLKVVKNALFRVVVHPTYDVFQMNNLNIEIAKKLISIPNNQKVILFFGFIREYKGLNYLIDAMAEIIKEIKEIKLLIVGDFENKKEKNNYIEKISTNKIEKYIEIYDGYIPDCEVEKFFAASDLVVLPYLSATQSGIIQIAYGFEKPVIATDVGGLSEVVMNEKTGYVIRPADSNSLSKAIIRYFIEDKQKEFVQNIRASAHRFSWDRIVETIEILYEGMVPR